MMTLTSLDVIAASSTPLQSTVTPKVLYFAPITSVSEYDMYDGMVGYLNKTLGLNLEHHGVLYHDGRLVIQTDYNRFFSYQFPLEKIGNLGLAMATMQDIILFGPHTENHVQRLKLEIATHPSTQGWATQDLEFKKPFWWYNLQHDL